MREKLEEKLSSSDHVDEALSKEIEEVMKEAFKILAEIQKTIQPIQKSEQN